MICKIIPIKQSRGIKDCWNYISDENKVISINKKDGKLNKTTVDTSIFGMSAEEYVLGKMDFNNVLAYMQNDKKTHNTENVQKKYISGYMCDPNSAVEEFLNVKIRNLMSQNKSLKDETGNHAYHIIQSFPENLDISDDEVHQCGRELVEKLGDYQAVICSHVHPVINDEGEITGKCKHNHILINSHIHPSKLNPDKPNIYKYNNCRKTYAQLQQWNDEIAIAHGVPIIREVETEKRYSWKKSHEENKGTSWVKQVANDIKRTMQFSANWDEFKRLMEEQGYHIRETENHVTYTTPDHTSDNRQKIRGKTLGREYTKEYMQGYWRALTEAQGEMALAENKKSKAPLISALMEENNGNLFVQVNYKNRYKSYYLDIPLKNPRRIMSQETLETYFAPNETYSISTQDHNSILEVTGQDIFDYYEELHKKRKKEREQGNEAFDNQQYYHDKTKINSNTNKPYKISLWDANGRKRTTIELVCILAMVIIKNEHPPAFSNYSHRFKNKDGKFIYAQTDWKLQNMYNTMVMARDKGIDDKAQMEARLDRVGKDIARKKKQLKNLTPKYNQMANIKKIIDQYEAVKEACEAVFSMPEGKEKEDALKELETEIEQYNASKRYMHLKNLNTPEQIDDFNKRYRSIEEHMKSLQDELRVVKEEYRQLKKMEYNIAMAENNQFCYGPDYNQPEIEEQTINKE